VCREGLASREQGREVLAAGDGCGRADGAGGRSGRGRGRAHRRRSGELHRRWRLRRHAGEEESTRREGESSGMGEGESSVGPIYRARRGEDVGGEKRLAKAINGGGHYLHVDCSRYFTNGDSKWGRERRRRPFPI
jgi:hypothetical protein